jgi:hypothetical protein
MIKTPVTEDRSSREVLEQAGLKIQAKEKREQKMFMKISSEKKIQYNLIPRTNESKGNMVEGGEMSWEWSW